MSNCRYETWSFRQLYDAIEHNNFSGKRLVVPIFQRGRCWDNRREHMFIDSLEKGYPVGSMLFYETEDAKGKLYVLVDGLQRSNCIKKYLTNPMDFVDIDTFFTKDFIKEVSKFLNNKNLIGIRQELNDFMITQKNFDEIQYYEPTSILIEKYGSINNNTSRVLCDMLKNYMSSVKTKYNFIKDSNIPVIVYSGDPNELPVIFDRINSQGVSLDIYELHAATYPQERTIYVENPNILRHVEKRYENFTKDGFKMAENNELISETKTINIFEYLFGLGKYITEKFEILDIVDKKTKEDDGKINPLGFELMNICINKTNNTLKLYEIMSKIDVNDFEKALNKAIIFVNEAIKPANKIRFDKKQLHSKSQILSMIGRTFRFMYKDLNLKELSEDWNKKTIDILQKNLLHYYIFDNITKEWQQGGDSYSFTITQNNRYLTPIDKKQWDLTLESYFENSLTKEESTKVSKPSNVNIAMLNVLYDEELINESIGVEYLIPKEYSKYLTKMYNISLPISSIANLCYLPNSNKRSKKENIRNFYEDKSYIKKFYTEELEQKYTFTSQNDFDFLKEKYTNEAVLKDRYKIFLKNRFIQLKIMFLKKMDIK